MVSKLSSSLLLLLLLLKTSVQQEVINDDATTFLMKSLSPSPEECFEAMKPPILDELGVSIGRKFLMATASDGDVLTINEWRKIGSRCIRGTPFNEVVANGGVGDEGITMTELGGLARAYFTSNEGEFFAKVYDGYIQDVNKLKREQNTQIPNLPSIDNPQVSPTRYNGRGNYLMASIHHIEHEYEQLTYLIERQLLPQEFFEVVLAYKYQIIPRMANVLEDGCVYFGVADNEGCSSGLRQKYYMLDE